ncbi:MAG TPA: GMP synthase [Candidatus Angelobacter sp.]|nr:GMP synthase [Candidatus Angelobacter sp.]
MALEGFRPSSYLTSETARLQQTIGDGKAIAAVSGGVDSTVAAIVAKRALGDRLFPVFIDTGFLRVGEPESVKARLGDPSLGLRVRLVKAGGRFLDATKGERNAEGKRKKFRETFYQVLGDLARKEGCDFVVQGTIAPDWIETQGGIKTQHNILEQIGIDSLSTFGFKVVEPISELYKDQVRVLGRHLDVPKDLSERQPFPGPGLLVRCIGSVSKKKLELLRSATKIIEEKLSPFNYDQYFGGVIENNFVEGPHYETLRETTAGALGLPSSEIRIDVFEDRVTGVKGDTRSYGSMAGIKIQDKSRETYGWLPEKLRIAQSSIIEKLPGVTRVAVLVKEKRGGPPLSVIVRAVSTRDFMTAAVAQVPWKILKDIAESILKASESSRVYYDITPKPPATIEFE